MVPPAEAKAQAARPVPVSLAGAPRAAATAAPGAQTASVAPDAAAAPPADAMAFTGPAPETVNGRIAVRAPGARAPPGGRVLSVARAL